MILFKFLSFLAVFMQKMKKASIRCLNFLLASMERLELPTVRLEGGCSIQLSYMDSISILTFLIPKFNCQLYYNYFKEVQDYEDGNNDDLCNAGDNSFFTADRHH